MLKLITEYIQEMDIKEDSAFEDVFGYLELYPLFRERKRYMDLSEMLAHKNVS